MIENTNTQRGSTWVWVVIVGIIILGAIMVVNSRKAPTPSEDVSSESDNQPIELQVPVPGAGDVEEMVVDEATSSASGSAIEHE